MATFTERKTGKGETRIRVEVRREGHPVRRATFTTRRDAERWARIREGEAAVSRHMPDLEGERHTVAELLDRWQKDITPKRREAVAAHLVWWRTAIGGKKLSEITAALLREKRDLLAREPYSRAVQRKVVTLTKRRTAKAPKSLTRTPATINRYYETICTAMNIAVREYEWLRESPARKVRDLAEPRGRVRFLSDDERNALMASTAAVSGDLYALVVMALCTGARAGELLALRWPDVDIERRVAIAQETKNGERRALSLVGPALQILKERRKVRRIDTDMVFPDPARTRDGKPRRFDYATGFHTAMKSAGIENFRFHDLRHTAASYLAMNGATTAELAAVLGHKTLQMVKRYSHLTDSHVSSVVARMTDKVFGGQS